jgi:VanZ family protein
MAASIWAWSPAILWMALIFAFSAQSSPPIPSLGDHVLDFVVRKAGHFTEYLILALLLYRPLRQHKQAFLLAFLITSLYAVSDELHQFCVPGREAHVRDWIIDSAGAALALGMVRLRGDDTI